MTFYPGLRPDDFDTMPFGEITVLREHMHEVLRAREKAARQAEREQRKRSR